MVAQEVCRAGRVRINGRTAKPGSTVQAGDLIELAYHSGIRKFRVLGIPPDARKSGGPWIEEIESEPFHIDQDVFT